MKRHAHILAFETLCMTLPLAGQALPKPAVAAPVLVLAPVPAPTALATRKPVFTVYLRERGNATQWFSAIPGAETYAHGDSLLRMSLAQRLRRLD